jgi:uncharacterized membrane protein YeaQ/YmgE (transglycosylase-associated protein family)
MSRIQQEEGEVQAIGESVFLPFVIGMVGSLFANMIFHTLNENRMKKILKGR